MEIVHRVALWVDDDAQRELVGLGVTVDTGFKGFDVSESDASWPAIRDWIERRRPSDIARALFTDQEVSDARWLALEADGQFGYPQPHEDEFGYRKATYDLADFCDSCGIGLRQVAPFQLKGEPRWGRRGILQVNWVYDEFFVKPEVWTVVFEPHGVGFRPVMNRSGVELTTVVQLVVEEEVGLESSRLTRQTCASCSRIKYMPVTRGPIPPLLHEPGSHLAKTKEWFGSGGSAYREVILSQTLARALSSEKVRGASFIPVASAETDRHG